MALAQRSLQARTASARVAPGARVSRRGAIYCQAGKKNLPDALLFDCDGG